MTLAPSRNRPLPGPRPEPSGPAPRRAWARSSCGYLPRTLPLVFESRAVFCALSLPPFPLLATRAPSPVRGPFFWPGSEPRICQHSPGALIRWRAPLGFAGEAGTAPQASGAAPSATNLSTCPRSLATPAQFVIRGAEVRAGVNRRVGGPRSHSRG